MKNRAANQRPCFCHIYSTLHLFPKPLAIFCSCTFRFVSNLVGNPLVRTFQGGGSDVVSVSCFGVRVSVTFHFMFVHYTFSSVWVAEWPPFGK